jgi:hypothetical protein
MISYVQYYSNNFTIKKNVVKGQDEVIQSSKYWNWERNYIMYLCLKYFYIIN